MYSPSLGLLLRLGEHNADPAFVQAHLDELQDERVPEAARLGLHREAADRWKRNESDASDGARRDVGADAALQLRALLADEGAEKSAARERDAQAQDAFPMELQPAAGEQRGVAALYIQA